MKLCRSLWPLDTFAGRHLSGQTEPVKLYESVFENGYVGVVGCHGRRPGTGARRRVMIPIIAQVIMASE